MSGPSSIFKVGTVKPDAKVGRKIVRATSLDGRHLTATVRSSDDVQPGDLMMLVRVERTGEA